MSQGKKMRTIFRFLLLEQNKFQVSFQRESKMLKFSFETMCWTLPVNKTKKGKIFTISRLRNIRLKGEKEQVLADKVGIGRKSCFLNRSMP